MELFLKVKEHINTIPLPYVLVIMLGSRSGEGKEKDGWIDGWMNDGQTDGQTDGSIDR